MGCPSRGRISIAQHNRLCQAHNSSCLGSGKINKANRDIVDYTAKIAEGNKSILAMDSLSTAAHTCLDSADSAIQNLTDFAAAWTTFGSSLRATMAALEQGGKEAYGALLEMDLNQDQEN